MWSAWKWLKITVSTCAGVNPAARKFAIQVPAVGAPMSPLPVSINTSFEPVLITRVVKVIGNLSVGKNASASACFTASGAALG